jgi:hypothetical protein
MPIPTPSGSEEKPDFIDRCMGDETMVAEYEEDDQRLAVCEQAWSDAEEARGRGVAEDKVQIRVLTGSLALEEPQKRAEDKALRKIVGYPAVFNSTTEIWPAYTEEVAPGAFERTLADGTDVRALVDHIPSQILGRRKAKTLSLAEDAKGLRFVIQPPNTSVGRDIVENIRLGNVDQGSFAFWVRSEEVSHGDDGGEHHRLTDLDLFDVSVVTFPAYEDTVVTLRQFRSSQKRRSSRIVVPDLKGAQGIPDPAKRPEPKKAAPKEVQRTDVDADTHHRLGRLGDAIAGADETLAKRKTT